MRLLGLLFFLLYTQLYAQYYTTHILHESELILPPDYDPDKTYPVVVMLPFTGGDAEYMFNAYAREAGTDSESLSGKLEDILQAFNANRPDQPKSFAVLLPKGKGSRKDHNWKGFELCFKRYEERVLKDLKKFSSLYNLDTSRIYLTGVSLGGDLSWALSLRNPEKFAGAMVMGSRCSYIPPDGCLNTMYEKNYAFFMTMGMKEANDRLSGMRFARKQLDSMQILNVYKEMPDLYHHKAPLWLFLEGMEYVLTAKNKVREIKSIGTDICVKTVGVYGGELEINYYDRNQEQNDLTMNGDGIFLPYKNEFLSEVGLEIYQCGPSKIMIRLMHENMPPFAAYTAESAAGGTETVDITIYEQEINGFKFRGTQEGDTDSKIHGFLSLNPNDSFLSISFDTYKSTNPEKWTSYTFFAKIE